FAVLYAAPLAIVAMNLYAFTLMPAEALFWFLTLYGFYALFHFSRQNIGVLSFVCLSSARRPIHATEKLILNGVVLCGMLAAPRLIQAGLLLIDPAKYAAQIDLLKPVIDALYVVGAIGYAAVLIGAVRHYVNHKKAYDRYTAVIFLLCVIWYLPL